MERTPTYLSQLVAESETDTIKEELNAFHLMRPQLGGEDGVYHHMNPILAEQVPMFVVWLVGVQHETRSFTMV